MSLGPPSGGCLISMGIMGPPGPNIGGNIIPGPGISGSGGRGTGPALERAEDIPGRLGSPGSGGSESGPEGEAGQGRESRLGAEPRPLVVTEIGKQFTLM